MRQIELYKSATRVWAFVPCFHDVQSFVELKRRAVRTMSKNLPEFVLTFVVVDDSGGQDLQIREVAAENDVIVVTAPYNLGHQGAIVFGLRKLAPLIDAADYIVTLDSDGEDQPEHIPAILEPLLAQPDNLFKVSLAQRTKRNENLTFKLLYSCFKIFFRALTGTVVRNGNFAGFRGWFVGHVIFHPYFDYCYSSSLLALPLTRHSVPLARGSRYYGTSKMTLLNLVSHGFRMLLPFAEKIAMRAIIMSGFLFVVTLGLALAAIWQAIVGAASAFALTAVSLFLFGFTMVISASSCIFFQIFNQTRALSLRSLTHTSPNPDGIVDSPARSIERVVVDESAAVALPV